MINLKHLWGTTATLALALSSSQAFAQASAAGAVAGNGNAGSSGAQADGSTGPADAPQPSGSPTGSPSNAKGSGLAEIVVTAQKRSQSLQRTPVVVEAVGQAALTQSGVRDFTTIGKVSPSTQVFQLAGATILAIRGLRSSNFDPTDESPVAVHVDGNYVARSTALNGLFYDLEQIEILPGPQGTLFGRNAAAGAVNLVTIKPQVGAGVTGYGQFEYGSYNLLKLNAAVNLPVSDSIAIRVAGNSLNRDGYFKNGLDDANQSGVRTQILYDGGGKASLLIGGDVETQKYKGDADTILASFNPAIPVPPIRDNNSFVGNGQLSHVDTRVWGVNGKFRYKLGFADLEVQGAHRELRNRRTDDNGFGNFTTFPADSQSTTGEIRLVSTGSKKFEWVAGLFGFHDVASGAQSQFLGTPVGPIAISSIDLLGTTSNSWAAFAQASWRPIDRLQLTGGIRYNADKKRGSSNESLLFDPAAPPTVYAQPETTLHSNKVTWKVGASYEVAPRSLIFANVSTGYKAAAIVYGPNPISPPQTVKAYEIGTKNQFFDNTLRINISAYYNRYNNFQLTYLNQFQSPGSAPLLLLAVTSIGGATIKGVELETEWAITRHDLLSFQANYLDAKFRNFDLQAVLPTLPNLSGRSLPNTPHFAGNASYAHTFDLASGATLRASAATQFATKRGVAIVGSYLPDGRQYVNGGYATVDLEIGYESPNRRWNVAVYGHNVTNHTFPTVARYIASGQFSGTVDGHISPPSEFGARAGVKF